MSVNDQFSIGGPMFAISSVACTPCADGRHEHRSPYGCGRPMGTNRYCGCKATATAQICGRCGNPIEGEARVSAAEYQHSTCPQ